MIIIKLLGVDQEQAASFVDGIQDEIAQAFETEKNEIVFFVPQSYLIFDGVDQTSYQLDIEVEAPEKFKPVEEQASQVLIKIFSENHVHVRILFTYFCQENEHGYINPDYPRYMTKDNMAHFEANAEEDEDTAPYMGDAFKDFDSKVKEKEEEQGRQEREEHLKRSRGK